MLKNLFLEIYRLRKNYFTSPARRNSYYFYNKLSVILVFLFGVDRNLVVTGVFNDFDDDFLGVFLVGVP